MQTKIIEVTDGIHWGKFLVGRMDEEFARRSLVDPECNMPLIRICGWGNELLLVLDLETREAAAFRPGGLPAADLKKHKIWVCPLFEPFLEWLYKQDLTDIQKLPELVQFEADADISAALGDLATSREAPAGNET